MAVHLVAESGLLLKSAITERELFVTLARPRSGAAAPARFRDWLNDLSAAAEQVTIADRITACPDPKDDKFPALIRSGKSLSLHLPP
jgi:hypothetical protein